MICCRREEVACGISPAGSAKALRAQPDGKVLSPIGRTTEPRRHHGRIWILECADLDEALAMGEEGAIACDVAGEVRELLFHAGSGARKGYRSNTPRLGNMHRSDYRMNGQREATALAPTLKEGRDKQFEIPLLGINRSQENRRVPERRATPNVRRMLWYNDICGANGHLVAEVHFSLRRQR